MNEEIGAQSRGGSKALLIILIIIVLAAIAGGGWYFFFKKSAEGGACTSNTKCETGLTCANKTCSSGKAGSSCSAKADCKTNYCVNTKCTEGKVSDACVTYKDCDTGFYCKTGACATPPDYTKYFSSVVISKIKPGSGPGPNNPETVTTIFKTTDAIEMDFAGVKTTTVGVYYYEIVNSTTGEVSRSSKNEQELKFAGRDIGTGTSLDNVAPGTYDLNIYFKDELVYTTQITIN
jgi:hypothetical protein